jgi:hypothetical protein
VWQRRPHVLAVDHHITEGPLHARKTQHEIAVNAVLFFDAFDQRGMLDRPSLARDDAPVGQSAICVLPHRLL